MDGHIRLGAHIHTGAALTVQVVKTLETSLKKWHSDHHHHSLVIPHLAAGALRPQLTLAALQQHTLAHYGGTHRLIAAQGPLTHQTSHHHQAGHQLSHHQHCEPRHSHHSPNSWEPHLQTQL